MTQNYYDTEHDLIISRAELMAEYNTLCATGEAEGVTFAQYINNCLTYNNGTLEEITEG